MKVQDCHFFNSAYGVLWLSDEALRIERAKWESRERQLKFAGRAKPASLRIKKLKMYVYGSKECRHETMLEF